MPKRNEYYGGEESDGAFVGCLLIAVMTFALMLVLGLAIFSIMAAV